MGKEAKLHQPLPWAPHTHSSPHSHYHLHHFISPTPPHVPYPHPQLWKNCLPQHWPLVPKRLGSKTGLCGLLQSLTNLHLLSEQNYGSINKKKRKICKHIVCHFFQRNFSQGIYSIKGKINWTNK